ncbi:MAG: FAD-dependent thymidylate synthase [Thermotogota bacterium]
MKNKKIEVLDKGFVQLVDHMGDDRSAVKAARVSYGKELSTEERDKKLINYLLLHGHFSPFEHISFTFHVKAPIFVVRQWFRHRVGMSPNEISRRYTSKQADEFYVPDHIRLQDIKNKQGSFKSNDDNITKESIKKIDKAYEEAYNVYKDLLNKGVAREMARMVLPVGQYTEFYLTANARALMHFFNLRADSHAQWEIQEYAKAMANIFQNICPWTYESFLNTDYKGNILG